MMYPLVRDLADDGIPVVRTCRVLQLCRQAYYRWLAEPVCERDWDDAPLLNDLHDAHAEDPEFGYRLLADEVRDGGWDVGERRVWRLCSQQRLFSTITAKGRKKARSGPPTADDLLKRQFVAEQPDQVWLTDITEHRTAEGKLYLCAIKDACSNRIVGWAIDSRMKARLAVAALETAVARRQPTGPVIVHSDRGSQYRSRKFRAALRRHGLVQSMGAVGACGDNAAMESFFALLQRNVLDRRSWATRDQLRLAIIRWIEHTYNHRRRQRRLGRLTPAAYELMLAPTTLATAA